MVQFSNEEYVDMHLVCGEMQYNALAADMPRNFRIEDILCQKHSQFFIKELGKQDR